MELEKKLEAYYEKVLAQAIDSDSKLNQAHVIQILQSLQQWLQHKAQQGKQETDGQTHITVEYIHRNEGIDNDKEDKSGDTENT